MKLKLKIDLLLLGILIAILLIAFFNVDLLFENQLLFVIIFILYLVGGGIVRGIIHTKLKKQP